MTAIEKMCKDLVSVDNYVRKCLLDGKITTGTSVRNLIVAVRMGKKTTKEAGFIPHRIAGKYFLEPLKEAKDG